MPFLVTPKKFCATKILIGTLQRVEKTTYAKTGFIGLFLCIRNLTSLQTSSVKLSLKSQIGIDICSLRLEEQIHNLGSCTSSPDADAGLVIFFVSEKLPLGFPNISTDRLSPG